MISKVTHKLTPHLTKDQREAIEVRVQHFVVPSLARGGSQTPPSLYLAKIAHDQR